MFEKAKHLPILKLLPDCREDSGKELNKNMINKKLMTASVCAVLLSAMTAFHVYCDTSVASAAEPASAAETYVSEEAAEVTAGSETEGGSAASDTASTITAGTSALDTADLFSDRDLEQTADLTGAENITVSDGQTYTISKEGVYVISGTASNAQIIVSAGDEDKVQLVLDSVSITNESTPCIYIKNADKVFVTTTDSENTLTVSDTFTADGDTNTDAVIFSRDDVIINGKGTLNIVSSENGVSSKDDLKVTGSTLNISCTADALEANEAILIADGTINIKTDKDGLHAENDEDNTVGSVYIAGGTITIEAGDDAIHATTIAQVDGGTVSLTAAEGIEGTYIQLNDGQITISASDDGINAGKKSTISTPTVEVNGGTVTITMGSGDTDAVDSNGNLILNGGTLDITAQSPFDYDGSAQNNGTRLIVNGTETDTITNQMMGGHGGMGGDMGGQDGMGGGHGGHMGGGRGGMFGGF